ncbi:DUF1642 domain-containing protein [uncultured Streptococcus sp.]|uniref:DUF1642 domain-containing protein n=1 Tax=uncultured Streptococcus sp. TaxID=83427 RepID=UPI00280A6B9F|nr:DUF1642 domain-containing protein [uncultured Streptococcus sp.]
MKYKLGDEVYLKGVITSISFCSEINYPYEVKTADEFILAAEQHLEPINKSELGHADEAPLYLRNVLARLRELPEHNRKVWMDEIMHEFANDYGSVKYTLGYEQGKFDGAVEAEKSEVIIPQFVADWIEKARETTYNIRGAIEMAPNGRMKDWLELNNVNIFAEAWVNGYEVEQEKRYKVKIPSTMNHIGQTQYLCKSGPNLFFCGNNIERFKFKHTRKELEDAGFGWCFSCEGVEVQEVEE